MAISVRDGPGLILFILIKYWHYSFVLGSLNNFFCSSLWSADSSVSTSFWSSSHVIHKEEFLQAHEVVPLHHCSKLRRLRCSRIKKFSFMFTKGMFYILTKFNKLIDRYLSHHLHSSSRSTSPISIRFFIHRNGEVFNLVIVTLFGKWNLGSIFLEQS